MSCSVLTVVAALCLVGRLSVGAGQAHGQGEAHWSEMAEVSPASETAAEAPGPSADSDGRQGPSQVVGTERADTTHLAWDATTAASRGVPPQHSESLVFEGDEQEEVVTTPAEDIVPSPPEDSFTTSQENILTTTQENVPATSEFGDILVMTPVLEDGRVPTSVQQLVICTCPLPTNEGCRRFLSGLYIDGKDEQYLDIQKPVSALRVAVHNVTCEKKDHRFMNLSEGQFFFRDRGDLILRNVADLEGLRVNDYCADPRKDKRGNIKWTIKVCVPPPSVPRCCPSGQALRGGKCEAANAPAILEPPMSVGLYEPPIKWPIIKNHYNPLTCTSDTLIAVPLVPNESYLLAVPTGLTHIWYPNDPDVLRKYTYPPDLCVDGYVDASGSVRYTANFCYTQPEELHHRVCDGHTCVRKCCRNHEEMSLSLYRCVPSNATTFTPHFIAPPDDYRIVNGYPLCISQVLVEEVMVDSRGNLHFNHEALTAREYCVDKFNDGLGGVFDKAKVCVKEQSAWTKTRRIMLPACQVISFLFLMLTVGCYCVVPELLQGGGWYQLFHVLSLMLAYASMYAQELFTQLWTSSTCLAMGIVLQFGFLATFFWLNVLCFEVWRKIRSLNNYLAATTVPIWVYLLYAFGMPAAIGVLTLCMQLFAPDGVPGLVKPGLANTRCFFEDMLTFFLYFYGPIAFLFVCNIAFITHTFWMYRTFEQNSFVLKKNSAENTASAKKTTEQTHRKRDAVSDFKQQFSLLVLMSSCWVTEVLSWLIPPPELWSATDILNSLQGFFIFVIFVANRSKRKHLKRKFPLPFKMARRLGESVRQCCCQGSEVACLSPVSSFTSQISRKLSSSSVVSNLSTLSTSLKFSMSSVSVTLSDDENVKRPSVFEPECGVTTLSHSSLPGVSLRESGDTQC